MKNNKKTPTFGMRSVWILSLKDPFSLKIWIAATIGTQSIELKARHHPKTSPHKGYGSFESYLSGE